MRTAGGDRSDDALVTGDEKPYRVLVVIGDQWDDPGSYCIDRRARFGGRTRQSGKDFNDVVTEGAFARPTVASGQPAWSLRR